MITARVVELAYSTRLMLPGRELTAAFDILYVLNEHSSTTPQV